MAIFVTSAYVPIAGLEPARLSTPASKAGVSTNSNHTGITKNPRKLIQGFYMSFNKALRILKHYCTHIFPLVTDNSDKLRELYDTNVFII